jgi:hypothetical protein
MTSSHVGCKLWGLPYLSIYDIFLERTRVRKGSNLDKGITHDHHQ